MRAYNWCRFACLEEYELSSPEVGTLAGRFEDQGDFQAFVPYSLPPAANYNSIMDLITEAHRCMGILDGLGRIIPNPYLITRPYMMREAVYSSRIEGTQASVIEAFQFELGDQGSDEYQQVIRIREVINYSKALQDCLKQVDEGCEIDADMLKHAHGILLHGVRGCDKMRGKFRKIQNWIGTTSRIQDAVYIPPAAHLLDGLLSEMLQFLKRPPANMPVLVLCALVHYQFESIHPFEDGNGRIGRLMIPLILAKKGMLRIPLLYLSTYFEEHKREYYECLQNVRQRQMWEEWIKFFLIGVIRCSNDAIDAIDDLLKLRTAYKRRLIESKAPKSAITLLDTILATPVISIPTAARSLGMGYHPARRAIDCLVKAGILVRGDSRKRNKHYIANEIMNLIS